METKERKETLMSIALVFLLIAIILWIVAAAPVAVPYVNVGWLGLAFYGFSLIVK
jgi:hypothetical protein